MEDKLLDCIKHIKEISKQKVTFDRIIPYLKKNEETTNHDEIQQILDKLTSENRIEVRCKSYFISTTVDTVLVPETQLKDEVEEENNTFITPLVEETVHPDTTKKDEMLQSILDELKKFRSFQDSVENGRRNGRMEDAIISNASAQKYSPKFPENTSNCSEIVLSILKESVFFLENEIKKKDNVIDFLMKKLVIGNNRQMFNDVVSTDNSFINVDDSVISNNDSLNEDNSNDNRDKNIVKRKVIVVGDSLLNGINERGLSKDFNVKANNILGGTSETVLDKIDELVKCKPSSLIVQASTNDLTRKNKVKKIVNEVKRILPNTKIAFSSIKIRKDKKDIDKNVVETNARLKNYCSQKKLY